MPRKKAKALPPKMITVYAEILQETEKAILVRCHDDADGVWLPKSQIKYSGERGDTGVEIEIPELLADEKGFFEGMGRPPAGKRSFGDNVKWLKEESITVTQPLSEAEKARYAEEMAALDKEIEELEDERAAISSRLKKQIDAKEQERREMSAHVNNGEERTFTCDCLKDYGTGELVWTEAYPPYNEVQRRKMTPEEMQPSLLEYSEKRAASAPAEAEGDTEPSEDDGTSFDEPEALDVDAVAGALSDAPSDAEGTKNEAPADAAAAPESDTPGCASCAHQDVDPNQNPEDDPCSGCLTAGGPHHYAPITATTEQGQGVGAVQ